MNGASARAAQLDSISDNLANTETPGFKAARPAFEAFLAASAPRDSSEVHPVALNTGYDLSQGTVIGTGNPLDIMPQDRAFLAVKLTDGIAFTRNGNVQVDGEGILRVGGHPMLDRNGTVLNAPPQSIVRIESNGAVFANDLQIGEVATFNLTGPINRVGPSLLRPQTEAGMVPVAASIRQGAIEISNSSPVEATVQMISAQRNFDNSIQALQTYKKLDDRAVEVGRIR